MTTRFSPKSRLRIAAAAAVVTVTAAIATVVTSTSSEPTAISSQLWSVEASEILGREFAIFRSHLLEPNSTWTWADSSTPDQSWSR